MKTEVLHPDNLEPAVKALKRGQLVAFPTETVYGLGADGLNGEAAGRIFQAKGRPEDNPLILHVENLQGLAALAEGSLPESCIRLCEAFWPGPLTVVVQARPEVPLVVRGGLDTVAVRAPDHPVARRLIAGVGRPLAAPSANLSGRPSPTNAEAVKEDLEGRIPYIIDGGPARVGLESTVVDCTRDPVVLLRPGGISLEMLADVVGEVVIADGRGPARAPGMKYRHYAPKAPVVWLQSTAQERVRQVLEELQARFGTLGLVAPEPFQETFEGPFLSLGSDDVSAAHRLFGAIRALDAGNPGAIVVVWDQDRGLGLAIQNRIDKAAAERIH